MFFRSKSIFRWKLQNSKPSSMVCLMCNKFITFVLKFSDYMVLWCHLYIESIGIVEMIYTFLTTDCKMRMLSYYLFSYMMTIRICRSCLLCHIVPNLASNPMSLTCQQWGAPIGWKACGDTKSHNLWYGVIVFLLFSLWQFPW